MPAVDARPPVRWIGGKTQLLGELLARVPARFTGYYEPFCGGAALFWRLQRLGRLQGLPVVLADQNPWLIELYREIRDDPDYLVDYLDGMQRRYRQDPAAVYLDVREQWNQGVRSAGMLVVLKQTSFNGVWRENRRGHYNVPWGKNPEAKILDAQNLRACSVALQGVELVAGDVLADWLVPVVAGGFYYFDPPYRGTFSRYGAQGFDADQHGRLIRWCRDIQDRGGSVLYSNARHPEVLEWIQRDWPAAQVHEVQARDSVNRDGRGRGKRAELLVQGVPDATVRFLDHSAGLDSYL